MLTYTVATNEGSEAPQWGRGVAGGWGLGRLSPQIFDHMQIQPGPIKL